MKKEDLNEFKTLIQELYTNYKNVSLDKNLYRSWWKSLENLPIDIDLFREAVSIYNISTDNKYNELPTPAKIVNIIIGNNEQRANEYWNRILFIIENIGFSVNIDLGDKIANLTFNNMGGFKKAQYWTDDALPFLKKEFIEMYKSNTINILHTKKLYIINEDIFNYIQSNIKNEDRILSYSYNNVSILDNSNKLRISQEVNV